MNVMRNVSKAGSMGLAMSLVAGFVAGGPASSAAAQSRNYDVKHGFVSTVPNCIGRAVFGYAGIEWAQSKRCIDIDVDLGVTAFGLGTWGPAFGPTDSASAPNSTALGKSEARVTSVVPSGGNLVITGYTRAFGSSMASVSGCSRRPRWLVVGSAFASSASSVAFGGVCANNGRIRFWGEWNNSMISAGFSGRYRLLKDPVSVKVTDARGNVTVHPIIKVNSRVRRGSTSWAPEQDGGATVHRLRNSAQDMVFEASVNGTTAADRGTLRIECRNGQVFSVTKTGLYFLSQPTPAVNSSSNFVVVMPPIDVPYSVPGGVMAELVMDGAGHADSIPDSVVDDCQPMTELFEGHDGAHLSTPQGTDTTLGIGVSPTTSVMVPINRPFTGGAWRIEAIDLNALVQGSDFNGLAPIAGASVRLWSGPPGIGSPIVGAGDLTTNRLTEVTPTQIYRAGASSRLDGARPIWKVQVDMSDMPFTTLPQVWAQIVLAPASGFGNPELLPNSWESGLSYQVDAFTGLLLGQVLDQTSRVALTPCMTVFTTNEELPCVVDYNDDAFVDFFDYLAFVEAFETGGLDADFNGDDFIDFFDYSDFVEAFEAGC